MKMDVMVESTRTLQVGKMLTERSISYEVSVPDCTAITPNGSSRRVLSPIMTGRRGKSPIKHTGIDWQNFYPLETVYKFMDLLEVLYPSTCTVIVIGKSVEGRDIKMLKISNSDARNTGVWLDGATHAREWISTAVVTFIASQIARNFSTLGESVTNKDWYFLPVVNPDGYHHTFTIDRMWRKNRARDGNTIVGVDLNRNFSYRWGFRSTEMSSSDPNHMNYRGVTPFSEPETTAIKDIILYSGTPFKIFLTFHAYSELISFPWCYSAEPCPDYVNLLEGGTAMAKKCVNARARGKPHLVRVLKQETKMPNRIFSLELSINCCCVLGAIYETNGRMYKVGNFKDIMYYASGTSIDWSYGTARIPFSYLVELRSKKDKFILPHTEIKDCCSEVYNGVLALTQFVDRKKCLNCSIFESKSN